MNSNSVDFTNKDQCTAAYLLPEECYEELQNTPIGTTIFKVLEGTSHVAYTRYLKIKRLTVVNEFQNSGWKKFQMPAIGKLDIKNISSKIIKKMETKLKNYTEYLNEKVNDMLDIGFVRFRRLMETNQHYKTCALEILNVDWVETHNLLIKDACSDIHTGIPNAIECMTNYTSQEQYNFWRRKVGLPTYIHVSIIYIPIYNVYTCT